MALKIIIPHRKKIALWMIFTNQKVQQYMPILEVLWNKMKIKEINTPKGVHIQ